MNDHEIIDHDPTDTPPEMIPIYFPTEQWAFTFFAFAIIGFFTLLYLIISTLVFILYTYWP